MTALANASGSLGSLQTLWLSVNQIGDDGIKSLTTAVASGSLRSLQTLYVDDGPFGTGHPQLKAACKARGIDLP